MAVPATFSCRAEIVSDGFKRITLKPSQTKAVSLE